MKNRPQKSTLFLVFQALALSMFGCTHSAFPTTVPENANALSTTPIYTTPPNVAQIIPPLLTPTIEFTKTPGIALTRESTLTQDETKSKVDELMATNANCALPCLWGFTPGETRIDPVLSFFSHLGWRTSRYDRSKDIYPYNGPDVRFVYDTGKDIDDSLTVNLSFYTINDDLEGISLSLTHPELAGRDQWLSMPNILKTYGQPDQIWVSLSLGGEMGVEITDYTGADLYLFYKTPFVLIVYHGVAIHEGKFFSICVTPEDASGHTGLSAIHAVSVHAGSDRIVSTPQRLAQPFGEFHGQLRVEEAFGLTVQEFQDRILAAQEFPCFSTPDDIWQ
jgi:hypothetical protein